MMEPSEAWERGERRRTRWLSVLVGAVLVMAAVCGAGAYVMTQQSQRIDRLQRLLDERTPVIAHIDAATTRVECLIEKQAVLLVSGVIVLLDDDNAAAVQRLKDQLAELEAAVAGTCDDKGGP